MASKKTTQQQDEVDILEIILILWKGKWKIILFTALTLMLIYFFQFSKQTIYFATTEIKPVSTFEEFKYEGYNNFNEWRWMNVKDQKSISIENNLFVDALEKSENEKEKLPFKIIDKKYLIELFINALEDNILIENEIKKSNLINKENYENNQAYQDAVINLSSSIKLSISEEKKISETIPQWIITFSTDDKKGWKDLLKSIEKAANQKVRQYLKNSLSQLISNSQKITNYKIEDIELKIDLAIKKYELDVLDRIIFLKEHAAIARKLEIKTNFTRDKTLVDAAAAVNSKDDSYYMRGYEMIEKEIQLIENRNTDQKKAFTKNLDELTKEKSALMFNKDLTRLKNLFKETPIVNSDEFYAGKIKLNKTQFETTTTSAKTMYIFAGLLGIFLGIVFVLFESAIRQKR